MNCLIVPFSYAVTYAYALQSTFHVLIDNLRLRIPIKMKVISLILLCSPAFGGNTVTWTTYTDDKCTTLCPAKNPADCTTTVDVTATCNRNSESSQDGVVCETDKITYTNYPNTGTSYPDTAGCDSNMKSFANELPVGVCEHFPGPVPTWKMIVKDTYDCTGGNATTADPTASGASATGATALVSAVVAAVVCMTL